jgi:hypothetical protein
LQRLRNQLVARFLQKTMPSRDPSSGFCYALTKGW